MKIVLTRLGELKWVPVMAAEADVPAGYTQTQVIACAVCRTDAKMWEQGHRDLVLPRVLGHEMVVQDISGTRYVVWPGKSCGSCSHCRSGKENLCDKMKITGFHTDGGFSSYAVLPHESLIEIPADLDVYGACFAEPVACIVNSFEKLKYEKGASVLIFGAGTMGLLTALFVKHSGLHPVLLEKNQAKIDHCSKFLQAAEISCLRDTHESEFDIVINCCADYIAFCQAISKVGKGGQLSFFSGLSKNEHIETNLLNLLHYKEVELSGVYGMTRAHMKAALPFIEDQFSMLQLLIEDVVSPENLIDLMPKVLAGKHLKYIVDFSGEHSTEKKKQNYQTEVFCSSPEIIHPDTLCAKTIHAVRPLPVSLLAEATTKIDNKTKPLGSLGQLEKLAVQMSCIRDSLFPEVDNKQLFVFAADHGITEEGVSAYPAEVTAQMVENFINGGAAINVLCRHHDIGMSIVDMGVNYDFKPHPKLIDKKIAKGTRNFTIEPAMSYEEMLRAIEHGMSVFFAADQRDKIDIIGLGEMGIGNTTSASAIISAITGISPAETAGRGTGVDDKGLDHKIEVIERALSFQQVEPKNGFDVLQKIGGFEIAGIAGAVLAAASKQCAVVLDGVISTAAGLIAYLIQPNIKGYLIAGHKSVEHAQGAALSFMGIEPIIDLQLRLGEGTGAALSMDLVEAACKILCEMASFDEAKIARSTI